MSRGHGDVQRRALSVLAGQTSSLDSIAVAGAVFDRNPVTASEATSVRRALRGLAAAGLAVDMGRHYRFGRRHWAVPAVAAAYAERVRAAFGKG